MFQGETAVVNPGSIDDPLGIEAQGILQVDIADNVVRNVAPRSKNLHAGECAGSAGLYGLGHCSWATCDGRPSRMELRNPQSPRRLPNSCRSFPRTRDTGGFDGEFGRKQSAGKGRSAGRTSTDPQNPSSTNDSRVLGYFWQAMTIMCCRNEGHTKAALILPLPGTHGDMVIGRREQWSKHILDAN